MKYPNENSPESAVAVGASRPAVRRQSKPRREASLKKATADLIDAVGGFERAADLSGVSRSRLFGYTDDGEDNAPRYINASAVRALEAAADYPHVTAYLAAERGFALLPAGLDAADGVIASQVARIAEDAARFFSGMAQALADGVVDAGEARREIGHLDRVVADVMSLRAHLAAIRDGEDS